PFRSRVSQTSLSKPDSQSSSNITSQPALVNLGAGAAVRSGEWPSGKTCVTDVPSNCGKSGGGEPARADVLPAYSQNPARVANTTKLAIIAIVSFLKSWFGLDIWCSLTTFCRSWKIGLQMTDKPPFYKFKCLRQSVLD